MSVATPVQPPSAAGPSTGVAADGVNGTKRKMEDDEDRPRQRPPMPPPYLLASLVPESAMFEDLIRMEQKLDWTMLRKKAEVNDAIGRPIRTKRILRVFVSNTAYNQPGMQEGQPQVNAETGEGVPGWTLKIEGRLLDTNNTRIDKTTKKKFSNCLKTLVVDMDNREPQNYPESNIVEWQAMTAAPDHSLDGFEIRRRGDVPICTRITMHLDQYPDRFKILPPLCDVIGLKEESRAGAMSAMWKFVKSVGAQDRDDPTKLRLVGGLEKLVNPAGKEFVPFQMLPEIVNGYLTHPDPVVIHYQIKLDKEKNVHPKCFDIPIEIEDAFKTKLHSVVQSLEGPAVKEVMAAEDEVARLAQDIRTARQKRDFLNAFATDPANFINRWLSTQARDLDLILGNQIGAIGSNGGGVREEDLRRSDLFKLPWVEEAITIHEGARIAEAQQQRQQREAAQRAQAQQAQMLASRQGQR